MPNHFAGEMRERMVEELVLEQEVGVNGRDCKSSCNHANTNLSFVVCWRDAHFRKALKNLKTFRRNWKSMNQEVLLWSALRATVAPILHEKRSKRPSIPNGSLHCYFASAYGLLQAKVSPKMCDTGRKHWLPADLWSEILGSNRLLLRNVMQSYGLFALR